MKTFTLPGTDMVVPNVVLGLMRIQDMTDEAVRTLVNTARDAADHLPRSRRRLRLGRPRLRASVR